MALGPIVRRAFGRHERLIAELWRSLFVDLDDWVATLRQWAPAPSRILELGCGEGASTERLAAAFPDAEIEAIDISDSLGRLYTGPRDRVRFHKAYAEELVERFAGAFDLIVMADVIHHVPAPARPALLETARRMLAPGGCFAFKDWARGMNPVYWFGYASDRWLTGDRVAFLTPAEARDLLRPVFGADSIRAQARVKPWATNYAICLVPR